MLRDGVEGRVLIPFDWLGGIDAPAALDAPAAHANAPPLARLARARQARGYSPLEADSQRALMPCCLESCCLD